MILLFYFAAIAFLLLCALIAFLYALEFAASGRYLLYSLEILLTVINGGTATSRLYKLLKYFRFSR